MRFHRTESELPTDNLPMRKVAAHALGRVLSLPAPVALVRAPALQVPYAPPAPRDRVVLDAPYVSQRRPVGAPAGYDGSANCGPTCFTMIARALGRAAGTDAELIARFAAIGATTMEYGTTIADMVRLGASLGARVEVKGGQDPSWMRAQLEAGRAVIANGDYYAMPPHASPTESEGHYVLVYGIDRQGRFLVHDPEDPAVKVVTEDEMRVFFARHEEGGFQLAVDLSVALSPAETARLRPAPPARSARPRPFAARPPRLDAG